MADLIAIVALGLQYSLIVFVINLWLRTTLPFSAVTITFLILAGLGMLLWHRKELSQTVKRWGPHLPHLSGRHNHMLGWSC